MERGPQIIEDALAVPAYRDYLRRRGRHLHPDRLLRRRPLHRPDAAAAAVEQLRLRLAPLLSRHGLADIELVIFDTHGESIGRGAHPSGFPDRFAYVASASQRRHFAEAGLL